MFKYSKEQKMENQLGKLVGELVGKLREVKKERDELREALEICLHEKKSLEEGVAEEIVKMCGMEGDAEARELAKGFICTGERGK